MDEAPLIHPTIQHLTSRQNSQLPELPPHGSLCSELIPRTLQDDSLSHIAHFQNPSPSVKIAIRGESQVEVFHQVIDGLPCITFPLMTKM